MMKLRKLAVAVMLTTAFTGYSVAGEVDLYKSENWQKLSQNNIKLGLKQKKARQHQANLTTYLPVIQIS